MIVDLKAVSVREYLAHWGLERDTFDAIEARRERHLSKVMKLPEWYYDIRGDVEDSDFVVVVGVRGAGKSALRRHIEEQVGSEIFRDDLGGLILSVSIDHDVRDWVGEPDDPQITLRHFVKHIIELITIAIATNFTKEELESKLSKDQRLQLDRHLLLVSTLPYEHLERLREKTRTIMNRVTEHETLKRTIEIVREIRGTAQKKENEETAVDFHLSNIERDLPALISIAVDCLGFNSIYVLVDEVDEYDETQADVKRAAKLVAPLLTSRWLLEREHLALKFFLSEVVFFSTEKLCEETNREIRWDRTVHNQPYRLEWRTDDIANMLERRLRTYTLSNHDEVTSFANLCDDPVSKQVDQEIASYSYRSPRYFIMLCSRLCRAAARHALSNDYMITKEIYEKELNDYCKIACKELYGARAVNTFLHFGRRKFTEAEFAEGLELSKEEAKLALIKLSQSRGLLLAEKYGGDTYQVSDPKLLRLLELEENETGSGLVIL